jgi:hypothetical protein
MKSMPISEWIWNSKYRLLQEGADVENDVSDTWRRVARAVACAEPDPDRWEAAFNAILSDFLFLPGGRVLAGAGTGKHVTLFDPGFDSGHFGFAEGNGRHNAPGWRYRLRLFEPATIRRDSRKNRIGSIGPAALHACLGFAL